MWTMTYEIVLGNLLDELDTGIEKSKGKGLE